MRLYNTANAFGRLPSEFFHFETEIAAWQLNETCLSVGRRVEQNVNNGKEPFHGFGSDEPVNGKQYRKVKGIRPVRKVKLKADGTF